MTIVSPDFRSARDAFRLVGLVKKQLRAWAADCGIPERLDILINNAVQTLTDSVHTERKTLQQEKLLGAPMLASSFLIDNDAGYSPKVRGGMRASLPNLLCGPGDPESSMEAVTLLSSSPAMFQIQLDEITITAEPAQVSKSSWVQSLTDTPYEDVISAHSVNFFVPLILYRKLLPLMGSSTPNHMPATTTPPRSLVE